MILYFILFSAGAATASAGVLTAPASEKNREESSSSLFTEKESKLDTDRFWEKVSGSATYKNAVSDDDTKLYAPPPGETGNPQKILSLGNADVTAFLLLSFFTAGCYLVKRRHAR
jgi:hypothetical protein